MVMLQPSCASAPGVLVTRKFGTGSIPNFEGGRVDSIDSMVSSASAISKPHGEIVREAGLWGFDNTQWLVEYPLTRNSASLSTVVRGSCERPSVLSLKHDLMFHSMTFMSQDMVL